MPYAFPLDSEQFRIETVVLGDQVTITLETTAPSQPCPHCGHSAARIHSRYMRHLADLPAYGARCPPPQVPSILLSQRGLSAEDFRRAPDGLRSGRGPANAAAACDSPSDCPRAWGEGGTRLADGLEMPGSPDTLLRLVRAARTSKVVPPRVVGVDDWAKRKWSSYGAIVCDLERHRVIDPCPTERRRPSLPG